MISATLELGFWPFSYVGGVTAIGSLTAENGEPLAYDGLELKIGSVPFPGVELRDIVLKWSGDRWEGRAKLVLRFAGGGRSTCGSA